MLRTKESIESEGILLQNLQSIGTLDDRRAMDVQSGTLLISIHPNVLAYLSSREMAHMIRVSNTVWCTI